MARFLLVVLCVAAAAYAQESTTHHPSTKELVDIGGIMYYFEPDNLGATWDNAVVRCAMQNMVLAGFETDTEWMAVLDYMNANAKTQWYWTNGQNMAGSNTWEWGAGGATFDRGDGRWAGGEPGNGPWDMEKVSVHVQDRTLTSEPSSVINSVICETAA